MKECKSGGKRQEQLILRQSTPGVKSTMFQTKKQKANLIFLLHEKILKMWRPNGELTSLTWATTILKLTDGEDYKRALTGGPWMIANHYLTLRSTLNLGLPWQRSLKLRFGSVYLSSLLSWVLRQWSSSQNGKLFRNLFKLIPVTELATRGRFAKICVQIDLSAPPGLELASIVKRLNMKEYIPYENAMGNT